MCYCGCPRKGVFLPFSALASSPRFQPSNLGLKVDDSLVKCAIAAVLEKVSFCLSHQLPAAPGFELSHLGPLVNCSTKSPINAGLVKAHFCNFHLRHQLDVNSDS
jgi:hypothetical protein